jgi:hypothetical protein
MADNFNILQDFLSKGLYLNNLDDMMIKTRCGML